MPQFSFVHLSAFISLTVSEAFLAAATVIAGRISQEYTEQVVALFSPTRLAVFHIQRLNEYLIERLNVQLSCYFLAYLISRSAISEKFHNSKVW